MAALEQLKWKSGPKTSELIMREFKADWLEKCQVSLELAKRLGNIYTGSLYNGLLSLVCSDSLDLSGKNILLFSYGSGCASSVFRVSVRGDYSQIKRNARFQERLNNRVKVDPTVYTEIMNKRR